MKDLNKNINLLFRVNKQGLKTVAIMIPTLFIFSLFISLKSDIFSFQYTRFLLWGMCLGMITGLAIANRIQTFLLFINTGKTRLDYFKSICIFSVICIFTISILFFICSAIIDLVTGTFNLAYYSLILPEVLISYIFIFGVSTFIIEVCSDFGALNGLSSILFIASGMIILKRIFINTYLMNNGVILNGTIPEITFLVISLFFIIASMFLIKKCEIRN